MIVKVRLVFVPPGVVKRIICLILSCPVFLSRVITFPSSVLGKTELLIS